MTSRTECSPRKIRRIQKKKKEDEDEKKDKDDKENDNKENVNKDNANKDNSNKDNVKKDKANKNKANKDKANKDKANKDKANKDKANKDKANKDNNSKDKANKDNNSKDNVKNDNNKDNNSKDSSDKDDGDKDSGDNNNDNEESQEDLVYGFYRIIIHPMILRLKSQRDKLNYSHWLAKLDECEDPDYKMPLIKMLFISLKNNRTFNLYAEPPVDDLSELNLEFGDTTMDMLRKAQETTNEYYILDNEIVLQEGQNKRSAAVATDMCSYIASKSSRYLAQSFYVRSDFPIQMWYNPSAITVPKYNDHNQWELYLNRFDLSADEGLFDFTEPHANTCESIMNLDQVPKELNPSCIFRWHPHSILYNIDRPKRSAGFMDTDQDINSQPITQQNIDESAFTIVHQKSFPGYKMLNPRTYSTIIMPDPDFVFNMTGVRITYNNVSHISGIGNDKTKEEIPIECLSKYESLPTKTYSVDGDETKTIKVKPKKPCSTKTTQNKKNYQKPAISSNSSESQQNKSVKSESNFKSNDQNKICNKCGNISLTNSKSKITSEPNMSPKKSKPYCSNDQNINFTNNQSKIQNTKQSNMASMIDTSFKCKNISNETKKPNLQPSGKSSRKLNNQNYEPPSNYDSINQNYEPPSNNDSINQNYEPPSNYDLTNQRNSKNKRNNKNKLNNINVNEGISKSKSSMLAMNECSDSSEKMSKPKYEENSDPEMNDNSEFTGNESSACAIKSRLVQQYNTKSSINKKILSSEESYNSGCSNGKGVNESFSCPTFSNSSDSLTSDLSSIVNYPDHELLGISIRSTKYMNSTKYSNNENQINRNSSGIDLYESLPSSNYTNEGTRCPFNNSKQYNSNANRTNPKEYKNNTSRRNSNKNYEQIDNNNEDMNIPVSNDEESCSSTSLNNSSRDLENISMPSMSYETSCSDDNASFDG